MIQTILVMKTYGTIQFSKDGFFGIQESSSDISLTAGLISAIYNLTEETQQQKIENLELEHVRSLFKEIPGESLFVITVDKRMDEGDAQDLLSSLTESFVNKYGEIEVDGMVLDDFEPLVDNIVEDKLWYNSTVNRLGFMDYITFLTLVFSAIFYPYWLLNGKQNIIEPLMKALDTSIINVVITSLILFVITILPATINVLLLKKYPNMKLPFLYASELLARPTRGGYAEMLPSWFLTFPVIVTSLFISVIIIGRGIQFSLTVIIFNDNVVRRWIIEGTNRPVFWYYISYFLIFYVITWYIIFPVITGVITSDLSWNWMKSNAIIISIALIAFIPAQFMAGMIYHTFIGIHPDNNTLFSIEVTSLTYKFLVTYPINFFLFLYIFVLGVSLSQLVKINKSRFPLGFGFSLFVTLAIQDLIFWLIFYSGWFGLLVYR